MSEAPDLVTFSRAGDIFHYRWAARRCLHLLDFNTKLDEIVIEGSQERGLAGEYVMDVSEYYIQDQLQTPSVEYFQLKHSTKQLDKPFTLSHLKGTFEGFSKRYQGLIKDSDSLVSVNFSIVTNRPISSQFKKNIAKLSEGVEVSKGFKKKLIDYTGLDRKQLRDFCSCLLLVDGEGNYDAQKHELQKELADLTSCSVDSSLVNDLVALVQEKVEPGSNRSIRKEDVLKRLGVSSEHDLFPAPSLLEKSDSHFLRHQHQNFYEEIIKAKYPVVISASGGSGKSILCAQLAHDFKQCSYAAAYDCYGQGGYRKASQPRHRSFNAYIQVANELAKEGLCEPILPTRFDKEDRLTRAFLERLNQSVDSLRQLDNEAVLVIMFDAVDNAAMAAEEFGDQCFARQLLREELPEGCSVVFFSRPERLHLLDLPSNIKQLSLNSFSVEETLIHLKTVFTDATCKDADEFQQLTTGNPRVQANALGQNYSDLNQLLGSFRTSGSTVDELIENQLNDALCRVKELFPQTFNQHINDICTGLATLPPFVPLEVLAAVSSTEIDVVRSFVTDLGYGRPLWLTDNAVQFRDEPTETWFQNNFSAKPEQIQNYVEKLVPLSEKFPYIAQALPSLFLKAGQYDQLIALALSDDMLPEDNPVDARNIGVFRLQFAFKAALKKNEYLDACKLALRAGEEMSGDERQHELLQSNLDLTNRFLSDERIQELAHRRRISGNWDGSDNIYAASLLSGIPDCQGEARSYLRSGWHWLNLYFKERDSQEKKNNHYDDKLNDIDILEMLFCHYRFHGIKGAVDFIFTWKPKALIYRICKQFSARLIDCGEIDAIREMALYGKKNAYLVIALTSELMELGLRPDKQCLTRCLNQIIGPKKWIKIDEHYHIHTVSKHAMLSFLEACVLEKLPAKNIRRALHHYIPEPSVISFGSHHFDHDRSFFMRRVSIKAALKANFDFTADSVVPSLWKKEEEDRSLHRESKYAREAITILLPWYLIRAELLAGKNTQLTHRHEQASSESSKGFFSRHYEFDPLPFEVVNARFFNCVLASRSYPSELEKIIGGIEAGKIRFRLEDKIKALRVSNRRPHLKNIKDRLELSCYQAVQIPGEDETSSDYANWFISLSRAVFASSISDASAYFEKAIEAVSRFGDEAVIRWEAIVNIARHCAQNNNVTYPELAHRFMRCAELIGQSVYREKHWDRRSAVEACYLLSPMSSFAISSRWRDRSVGWQPRVLSGIFDGAIDSQNADLTTIWALSAFDTDTSLTTITEAFLSQGVDSNQKQYVFDTLVREYRNRGITGSPWQKIQKIAQTFQLVHPELDNIDALLQETCSENRRNQYVSSRKREKKKPADLLAQFKGVDFTSDSQLKTALDRFRELENRSDYEPFWYYIYQWLPSDDAEKFILLVANAEYLNLYDIREAFRLFPKEWKLKPAIEKSWPRAVSLVVERFCHSFADTRHREYIIEDFGKSHDVEKVIQKALLKALSLSKDLHSADTFFGFAGMCKEYINSDQAHELLDFALSRLETHIAPDYADGLWSEEFSPPRDNAAAIAGYIWAGLGAPEFSERWRAVHSVRRLYELECQQEINALIGWMIDDKAPTAFLGKGHPFYRFHAKQYLLMALTRCAIQSPKLLHDNNHVFLSEALFGEPHVFIQKYAANIAVLIEADKTGTYKEQDLKQLNNINCSPFPLEIVERNHLYDTPWHKNNENSNLKELYLAHDFDRYWFNSLARVFNVPTNQVESLAKKIILKDWALNFDKPYMDDPRREIFNKSSERETWHSHSEYPKTDDYRFYLSYHAMLKAAAMLLQEMPVTSHYIESQEEPWSEWLEGHAITTWPNYWLSDRRDSIPIERRSWVSEKDEDSWLWEIKQTDFLEILFKETTELQWLVVQGYWNEYANERNEQFQISSKLIPSWASQSLLYAIESFDESDEEWGFYSFRDSDFGDHSIEQPFQLSRWVYDEGGYTKLDRRDPYSGEIEALPYSIETSITERFGLSTKDFGLSWYEPSVKEAVLKNIIWSQDKLEYDTDHYCRKGTQMLASVPFLKKLCKEFNSDIAFEISIERSFTSRYRNRNDNDDLGYCPPCKKVYIFSQDGRLRDAKTSHRLREKAV